MAIKETTIKRIKDVENMKVIEVVIREWTLGKCPKCGSIEYRNTGTIRNGRPFQQETICENGHKWWRDCE